MKIIPEIILGAAEPDGTSSTLAAARMVRPGLVSIADQAVVSGTNFLTTMIIARTCSPEELGIYALAWTVVVFLAAMQCNLITIPYTMYCHRHDGRALAEYSGSTLVQQLLTSLAAVACFLVLDVLLSLGYGPVGVRPAAWVLLGVVPLLLLREYARRFALAHLAMSTALAIDATVASLQITALLVLGWLGLLSPAVVYGVMGGACAVACLGWWMLDRRPMRFSGARFLADCRRNWSFGRWALLSQLTGLGFYSLPWILALVHGEAQTGVLAACTALVGLSNLFVLGLNNFLMPKAARAFTDGGSHGLCRVLRKTLLYASLVLGGLCVAVYFTGDFLAWIAYGKHYANTGSLITVLAVATFADAMGLIASTGLWAMDRPAVSLIGDMMQLLVTLGAALWLVFPYGAMGIAAALVAGRLTGAAVRWMTIRILMGFLRCEPAMA